MIAFLAYLVFFVSLLTSGSSVFANCNQLPPHGISPLFTFGHSILNKKQIAVSEEVLFAKTEPYPTVLSLFQLFYGITDSVTIYANIPAIGQKSVTSNKSNALGDCYCNVNAQLYKDKTDTYSYRIIGIGGVRFPTSTGLFGETIYTYNTTSFFLGLTYDALTFDWLLYSDFGALLFTKRGPIQFGHLINVNSGAGRSFCINENYLSFFLELSNFYFLPNRINSITDLTTGGNILLIGPTIRFAHKNGFLIQSGIQINIGESLRSRLDTIKYIAGGFIAYTF